MKFICMLYIEVFCLTFRSTLTFFQRGWNCHRLRREGNQSPLQLWTRHQNEAQQEPMQVDMEMKLTGWDHVVIGSLMLWFLKFNFSAC
ncbi:hypothetical protein QQF64_023850 [Cirrhinus molitorella]|uniref:Integrase core domain-containing protein n=1 Tax=Cirrhinus molitorella TaxID=172907 RepID=A0ABR3NJZ5_9TELE